MPTTNPNILSQKLIQVLLELASVRGNSATILDDNGQKKLEIAEKEKEKHILSLVKEEPTILEMRRDSKDGYNGFTPLAIAAHCGLLFTFKLLLDQGAQLYSTNNPNTPCETHQRNILSNAAYNRELGIIQFLETYRPNDFNKLLNTPDSKTLLPLDYTTHHPSTEVADFLKEKSKRLIKLKNELFLKFSANTEKLIIEPLLKLQESYGKKSPEYKLLSETITNIQKKLKVDFDEGTLNKDDVKLTTILSEKCKNILDSLQKVKQHYEKKGNVEFNFFEENYKDPSPIIDSLISNFQKENGLPSNPNLSTQKRMSKGPN